MNDLVKSILSVVAMVVISLLLSMMIFFGGNFGFKNYQLQNGQIVECRIKYLNAGSVNLNYCKDGKQYLGQKNVVQLS